MAASWNAYESRAAVAKWRKAVASCCVFRCAVEGAWVGECFEAAVAACVVVQCANCREIPFVGAQATVAACVVVQRINC